MHCERGTPRIQIESPLLCDMEAEYRISTSQFTEKVFFYVCGAHMRQNMKLPYNTKPPYYVQWTKEKI